MGFDTRDVTDKHRFIADMCDIGVLTREDRQRLIAETAEFMPQAVCQALASFLVNQRNDQVGPAGRAAYIIQSARTQHARIIEQARSLSGRPE